MDLHETEIKKIERLFERRDSILRDIAATRRLIQKHREAVRANERHLAERRWELKGIITRITKQLGG